jgi:hypothetical protein
MNAGARELAETYPGLDASRSDDIARQIAQIVLVSRRVNGAIVSAQRTRSITLERPWRSLIAPPDVSKSARTRPVWDN